MKKLLNTLYVTSENSYLSLDGENVVVLEAQQEIGRLPLHNLEGIVSFGYRGTSPALMGACAERNISLCYLSPQGKFLARISGRIKGNVILREQQFASKNDEKISLDIARNCITGKVYNARWVLERAVRDHALQIDMEKVKAVEAGDFTKEPTPEAKADYENNRLTGLVAGANYRLEAGEYSLEATADENGYSSLDYDDSHNGQVLYMVFLY